MKLIFIHGRAQEDFDASQLKKGWTDTLKKGLQKSGLTLPANVTIEFPYYGKLLKKLVDEVTAPPAQPLDAKRSGVGINEAEQIEFFEKFIRELALNTNLNQDEMAKLMQTNFQSRGLLNWEIVQKLLAFMDEKHIFGDTILKKFTLDVFVYLTVENVKKQINDQVLTSFNSAPCVVVGHSMGSIVSYLILKNNPNFNVKQFITVGSPLGLESVHKYLELPLRRPACIQQGWFNAYDERDVVALKPLDKDHFNILPRIDNYNGVKNHTDDRHGIEGYLDDQLVAQKIYDTLILPSIIAWSRLSGKF